MRCQVSMLLPSSNKLPRNKCVVASENVNVSVDYDE